MKLTTQDKILNTINTARFATAYNLEPYFSEGDDLDDRLQTPYRALLTLEKKGLIKPVPVTPPVEKLKKYNKFYTPVTKPIESISEVKLRHESGIADVVLSLIFLYPDYDVTVRHRYQIKYNNGSNYYEADAYITLDPYDKNKHSFSFIVEFERTREVNEIIEKKLKKIESLGNLHKLGLPPFTKVLIVLSHENYKGYWRPCEYDKEDVKRQIRIVETKFNSLLKKVKWCPDYFRFMAFPDFYRLNEAVWFSPTGTKVKLIN